jgi:hypothetical protein
LADDKSLLEEINLLSLKMPAIDVEHKDNVLRILKHFGYFIYAKNFKPDAAQAKGTTKMPMLVQILVENPNFISKPQNLATVILEKLTSDGSNISEYILASSTQILTRNFPSNHHATLLLKLLKLCRAKIFTAFKFDNLAILRNLTKIFTTKQDQNLPLTPEDFAQIKEIFLLISSNKEKDLMQKFITAIFGNASKKREKFEPGALGQFFSILEDSDFVGGGHKGSELVEFLLEVYLEKFETGEVQNLVELENSQHVYNCL